jgi:hypothetical protein
MAFGKKPVVSIQEAAVAAVSNIDKDFVVATDRADAALSTFRAAATELKAANDDLAAIDATLASIADQISSKRATIALKMSDNSAVASKIEDLYTIKK